MEELTIGAVAQRAGIRPSAIRYYESVEVLPAPRRDQRTPVVRLQRVRSTGRHPNGATGRLRGLCQIRTLFNGFAAETPASARWEALARQKLVEVDTLNSPRPGDEASVGGRTAALRLSHTR